MVWKELSSQTRQFLLIDIYLYILTIANFLPFKYEVEVQTKLNFFFVCPFVKT